MSQHIQHVSDDVFEEQVIKSSTPVLVDFWAEWCGPCKMIAPILDKIAPEYADRLKIAKINVDENEETPTKYKVRGIPTLILFKNGEPVATKVGTLSETQLVSFLKEFI